MRFGIKHLNRRGLWIGLAVSVMPLGGCQDPDLADQEIPHLAIEAVTTPYGVTLDENASPQQVVYAFLRAARDDFLAAQAGRSDEQKAAFFLQIQLAAANRIKRNLDRLYARDRLPVEHNRDEAVYKAARAWTPVVAHYIEDFAGDEAAMTAAMRTQEQRRDGKPEASVLYDVSRDDSAATVLATLVREADDDGKSYWRILRVGFARPARTASASSSSRAVGQAGVPSTP